MRTGAVTPPARGAGDGRRERFTALVDAHRRIVHKVAAVYASGPEDARDLAQEIAAQLWRAFPGYDAGRPFSTWMYRVALNVAISHARRERRPERQALPLEGAGVDEAWLAAPPPEEPDERVRTLRRLIAALGDLDRALVLLYLEERSHREIAEVLGITETNVATKLGRLKARLRAGFAAEAPRDEGRTAWSSKT